MFLYRTDSGKKKETRPINFVCFLLKNVHRRFGGATKEKWRIT